MVFSRLHMGIENPTQFYEPAAMDIEIYLCRPNLEGSEEDIQGGFQPEGPASAFNVNVVSSGVWEHLPEELVERLLLLLPIDSQVRFRSVSTRWLDLLSSPSFLRKSASLRPLPLCCTKLSIRQPWFAARTGGSGCFLDLSHLPPRFGRSGANFMLVQDGLILLGNKWSWRFIEAYATTSHAKYCVANPLDTKAWRELPPISLERARGSIAEAQMEVAPDCSSFLVFFRIEVRPFEPCFEFTLIVYSSITDSWEPDPHKWQGVRSCCSWLVTKGILYLHDHRDDTLRLVNMENGHILKVAHMATFTTLRSYDLLVHKGDAYAASEERTNWKLEGTTWELIAEMPASLLTLANPVHQKDLKYMFRNSSREGDYICLGFFLMERERWQMIAFHIPNATWHAYPEIPGSEYRGWQTHTNFPMIPMDANAKDIDSDEESGVI